MRRNLVISCHTKLFDQLWKPTYDERKFISRYQNHSLTYLGIHFLLLFLFCQFIWLMHQKMIFKYFSFVYPFKIRWLIAQLNNWVCGTWEVVTRIAVLVNFWMVHIIHLNSFKKILLTYILLVKEKEIAQI